MNVITTIRQFDANLKCRPISSREQVEHRKMFGT